MGPNPVEIFGSYMSWKFSEDTHIISFMGGSQFMYLLEGEEKALLIDTGWGAGNLRVFVEKLTDEMIAAGEGAGTALGTGGMKTKLDAAEICMSSACDMIIMNGKKPELLYDVFEGKSVGTKFKAEKK